MTWERTNRGLVATLFVGLALACFAVVPGAAAREAAGRPSLAQPAMPLAEALRRFARASGYDVVFQEGLVKGRQSAVVVNPRNAHEALTQLLAGSGLVPSFTRPDAFILKPLAGTAPPDLSLERIEIVSSILAQREKAYRWYGEKLLEASLATLRRSPQMAMRSYDFTIYVWLSKEGAIIDLDGRGAADQGEVMGIAATMLKGLVVGIVPPENMPQPVGLRIMAQ